MSWFSSQGPGGCGQFLMGLAFCAALSTCAAGQEIVTGLDNEIWHVFHARNKDYWFGSHSEGAYRYDGNTLVRFTTKDGLPSNAVSGFQEDEAGNIYIAAGGVSKFDGKSIAALSVAPDSDPADWSLEKDDLWFPAGQDTGAVYRYDGESLHLLKFPATAAGDRHYEEVPRHLYPNAKYSPYDVYVIFRDSTGSLWFGTATLGACRYDGTTFTWIGEEHLRNGSFGTRSIVEDKEGKFWFCNTLHRYSIDVKDPASPAFVKEDGFRNPKDPGKVRLAGIMSAVQDDAGDLWIATLREGVWRFDGTDLIQYPVLDAGKQIDLYLITRDRDGTLWLASQYNGAWRFNGKSFEKFEL